MINTSKHCPKCATTKSLDEFYRTCGHCKVCINARRKTPEAQRKAQLRHRFGMSEANYTALLEQQNGVCAICSKSPGKRALGVDHDHQTGLVRGLLCVGCNINLGHFEFNHDAMTAYLRSPPAATSGYRNCRNRYQPKIGSTNHAP
jgi:hypothetical protein